MVAIQNNWANLFKFHFAKTTTAESGSEIWTGSG